MKIALILDRGGKDDKSFNSSAFRGATEAKEKLGISLKEVEVSDDTLFEPAMRSFASKGYDLIIGIGVTQAEAIKKVAAEMPNQKFAVIDAKVDAPNVLSVRFEEHQGSFLVGYIAGLKSKTKGVGFIGGMDIPLIRRFEKGFLEGVKASNPKARTFVNYVGVTSEAWNNPTKAKELAQNQYAQGADVIFAAAGASNNGVFDAAEENKRYAIGVDSNQNWVKPGRVLTSMLKHVDQAVFKAIQDLKEGKFKAGIQTRGLKEMGIGWALDEYNRSLFTEDEVKKIEKVRKELAAGKIKVTDYYLTRR